VVCLIDPVGDVYACPFAIHQEFLAGSVRQSGGFEAVWRDAELFAELRRPQSGGACRSCAFFDSCRGGCMAAKFFTGLPLDGPDPECVQGYGAEAINRADPAAAPRPAPDHSHRGPVRGRAPDAGQASGPTRRPGSIPVTIGRRPELTPAPPARACDESPLAGFAAAAGRP
jgi:radical SAM protein with 4Fe4S-binding SPASM domain